jgi:hypothetical protein
MKLILKCVAVSYSNGIDYLALLTGLHTRVAAVGEGQQTAVLAGQHRLVRLSVLLVHGHVDQGVDARRHVQEQIAHHVQA